MTAEIAAVERFGRDELLAALRRTRLRGFGGARPYENATLELVPAVDPDALAPAQRYVLRPTVERILALRAALAPHGVDPFALDGGVHVHTGGEAGGEAGGEVVPLIPPIVEESTERDGRTALVINDGIHRVFAARSAGLPIAVVLARGVPPEYPYYAYALDDGWAGVALLDELPERFQKKEYRRPDAYKALFREFNEVFPGVQQERRKSNPAHLTA